jgi:hypothetical protein
MTEDVDGMMNVECLETASLIILTESSGPILNVSGS